MGSMGSMIRSISYNDSVSACVQTPSRLGCHERTLCRRPRNSCRSSWPQPCYSQRWDDHPFHQWPYEARTDGGRGCARWYSPPPTSIAAAIRIKEDCCPPGHLSCQPLSTLIGLLLLFLQRTPSSRIGIQGTFKLPSSVQCRCDQRTYCVHWPKGGMHPYLFRLL